MARTLDVYLHNELVGQLVQDDGGQMVFDYAESWLNKPGATRAVAIAAPAEGALLAQ